MKEEEKGREAQKIVELFSAASAPSNWFPQHVRSEKKGKEREREVTLGIGSALSKSRTTDREAPMPQRTIAFSQLGRLIQCFSVIVTNGYCDKWIL